MNPPSEVSHAEYLAEIRRIAEGEPGWSSEYGKELIDVTDCEPGEVPE